MQPLAELRSLASMRARIYGLGQALTGGPPSSALFERISADPSLDALAGEMEPVALILESAKACLNDADALREAGEEYARLYVGPAALPSPLWESVYRDPEHLLFGEATLDVRRFYARHDLAFAGRGTEPDDHIALELEFMCRLAARSAEELNDAGDLPRYATLCLAQADFLETHLLTWAPQSFALQLPHVRTGLYRGIANLIVGFPPSDFSLLTELSGEISYE